MVLSHLPTIYVLFLSSTGAAIKALIILGYSRTRLAVRSKPVRLNIYLGSNNIGGIVIKLRAMQVSYKYRFPFTLAC